MQIRDAIVESIRSYWMGIEPEKISKTGQGRMKYTKKYFDKFETKQFGDTTDIGETS